MTNCCKVTIINSDCLYGRYSCNNPCLIPPFIGDSITRTRCNTVSILIDHDTWRHYYRAKDTLPASYYNMHPKDRKQWEKGKARTLGYSNGSGSTKIDSLIFEDSSIATIIFVDYSQKTWDGAKILIDKIRPGDLPIKVWTEKGKILSVLHITDSSLTSERVCKRTLSRDKGNLHSGQMLESNQCLWELHWR